MNDIRLEQTEGRKTLSGDWLRLEFRWHKDRWGHSVGLASPSGWLPAFHSIEAFADSDASRSASDGPALRTPALQQLHVDEIESGVCAMGVGQAGEHHFAVTFALDAARPRLTIDVADRIRGRSGNGGVVSAYELAAGSSSALAHGLEPKWETSRALTWQTRDARFPSIAVRGEAVAPQPAADLTYDVLQDHGACLQVLPPPSAQGGGTLRWIYSFAVATTRHGLLS